MAFPQDIDTAVANNKTVSGIYAGPYKSSGGDFYTLSNPTNTTIGMYKNTNPGTASWVEQDSGDRPTNTAINPSADSVQDGDTIHIAYSDDVVSYRYVTFDMSTDQWGTSESIVDPTDTGYGANDISIAISRRSDGDLVVLYNGDAENIHGTRYLRVHHAIKVSSWTVDTQVSGGGEDDWHGSVIVPGSSDRMHFFFNNTDLGDAYQRTLRSDDNMESLPSAFDSDVPANFGHAFRAGISYDDGGTQKIRAPYRDDSNKASVAEFDSADTPSVSVNVDVGDNTTSSPVSMFMLVDGTDNHLLYASSLLVHHDKNDGTDVQVLSESGGPTVGALSGTIYEHGGDIVIAFTYVIGGQAKYFEFFVREDDATVVQDMLHSIGVIPFAR